MLRVDNGNGKELIDMTQDPFKKSPEPKKPESNKEDYLDEKFPGEDHDDALVDEQIDESFPASDPPANY